MDEPRKKSWSWVLAAAVAMVHYFAINIVLAWLYWIVPRSKFSLDSFGVELSTSAELVILQSDLFVNFCLPIVLLLPAMVGIDFLLMLWLTRRIGMKWMLVVAIAIAVLILAQLGFGQYVLSAEFGRLRSQLAVPAVPAPVAE